jgi:hypothetical protein
MNADRIDNILDEDLSDETLDRKDGGKFGLSIASQGRCESVG